MKDRQLIEKRGEIMGQILGLSFTGYTKTKDEIMAEINRICGEIDEYDKLLTEWVNEGWSNAK